MTDRPAHPALRRKLVARRPGADIGRMTPLKGFRLAFARAAPDSVDMDVGVRQVSETRLGRDLLRDRLPDNALITLIEGHGRRFGLVVFDADSVGAAVEAQTMGQVNATPPPPRAPTRTDAVLLADLVDRVHEILEVETAEVELGRTANGFRYATVLDGPRAVGLTLEDVTYRLFDLRVDLGGSVARPGRVLFAYPALDPVVTLHTPDAWASALERAVEPAEAEISAHLARVTLPFDRLASLGPGDLFPIPRESLVRVTLVAANGVTLGRGRLGQAGGRKAVRLTSPDDAFAPAHDLHLGQDSGADVLDMVPGAMAWDDPGTDGAPDLGGGFAMPGAGDAGLGDLGGGFGIAAAAGDAGPDGGFAMALPMDFDPEPTQT
jgi:flagellar motor switch protein FliM